MSRAASMSCAPGCGPLDIDGAEGAVDGLARIAGRIPEAWSSVRITVRGDSGCCREGLIAWRQENGADFVVGLARNARLERRTGRQMRRSRSRCALTGEASRCFRSFRCRTWKSWSRTRRVAGRAEALPGLGGTAPLCGHQPAGIGIRRPGALRGPLLRQGRHGEQDQGAAAGAVRRRRPCGRTGSGCSCPPSPGS